MRDTRYYILDNCYNVSIVSVLMSDLSMSSCGLVGMYRPSEDWRRRWFKRVKVVREDNTIVLVQNMRQVPHGTTCTHLHPFVSSTRLRGGDDVEQLRGQLRIYLVISMLHYGSIIDTTLRNKFFRSQFFSKYANNKLNEQIFLP